MQTEFEIKNGVLKAYHGKGGDIVIPEGVTSIRYKVFYNRKSITSVKLPEGLIEIGDGAFEGCTALTQVSVPDSLQNIGQNAFSHCEALTVFRFPNSLREMKSGAFQSCTALESVSLPGSLHTIYPQVFLYCFALKTVQIADGVTEIAEAAFARSGIQKAVIPDTVRIIAKSAFADCSSLTDVRLPRFAQIARTHDEEQLIDHPQQQGYIKETVRIPGAFFNTPFGKENGME
ncbi:MAG: leucine-rich repeat domain-containing protein [Oscillospiraceae bacterium]|nr:leucine-rich repeat domain-containing protein [Oscillospiraceae bacterium]